MKPCDCAAVCSFKWSFAYLLVGLFLFVLCLVFEMRSSNPLFAYFTFWCIRSCLSISFFGNVHVYRCSYSFVNYWELVSICWSIRLGVCSLSVTYFWLTCLLMFIYVWPYLLFLYLFVSSFMYLFMCEVFYWFMSCFLMIHAFVCLFFLVSFVHFIFYLSTMRSLPSRRCFVSCSCTSANLQLFYCLGSSLFGLIWCFFIYCTHCVCVCFICLSHVSLLIVLASLSRTFSYIINRIRG